MLLCNLQGLLIGLFCCLCRFLLCFYYVCSAFGNGLGSLFLRLLEFKCFLSALFYGLPCFFIGSLRFCLLLSGFLDGLCSLFLLPCIFCVGGIRFCLLCSQFCLFRSQFRLRSSQFQGFFGESFYAFCIYRKADFCAAYKLCRFLQLLELGKRIILLEVYFQSYDFRHSYLPSTINPLFLRPFAKYVSASPLFTKSSIPGCMNGRARACV